MFLLMMKTMKLKFGECCFLSSLFFRKDDFMLKGNIILNDQECECSIDFRNTEKYMTKGFKSKFGDEAEELFSQSIDMIMEKYPNNADYLQVLCYEDIKYYLIVDDYGNGRYILTALLPEEY